MTWVDTSGLDWRTPEISGPRPLTKLQTDGGIAGPLHRVVLKGFAMSEMQNTDFEVWRERTGDYYSDSVRVTQDGAIGISSGGTVVVRTAMDWVGMGSLTDYERLLIAAAADEWKEHADRWRDNDETVASESDKNAAILRGLLERM
jgi:hypothetical protein